MSAFAAEVATIGSKKISVEEFQKRFQQNVDLSPQGMSPNKEDVLNNIINFELAIAEANRKKLANEKSVQEQIDILLYQELVRREIQPKIDSLKVAESDVRSYYKDNPLVRTKHIIFLTTPEMTELEVQDVEKQAQKVLAMLNSGKRDFESLVKEYSEGPSAKTGGDVDWGARHKLIPEYYEAALRLKTVGKTSPVISTPYGFHIIKLTGIKPYSQIDKNYKAFAIRTLKEVKGKTVYDKYFASLKKRFPVKVNKDAI
jgi:parvulin-like peptidyl-prolyl isomerase